MPIAVVTGPNSGIGRVTAIQLAGMGYHVVAAGRSEARVRPVIESISSAGGTAEFLDLDLASLTSVRTAANRLVGSGRQVDVLVNNAGIGINRRGRTQDGFEVHFGINHLGHFLLTRALGATFRPGTRVVSVSSAVHFRARGLDLDRVRRPTRLLGYSDYAQSKLANVLFIRELAKREPGINSYAVHPGLVNTPLIPGVLRYAMRNSLLTPEQGADTVVWCATSDEVAGDRGRYYQRREAATPSVHARSDELAAELWERSLEWCG